MYRKTTLLVALLVASCLGCLTFVTCGGDGGGCPGIVCSDCGASGDCDVTCTGDDVEYCGHFGYFDDPDMRCAFCAPPDFEP
jgi:hypothetical protein